MDSSDRQRLFIVEVRPKQRYYDTQHQLLLYLFTTLTARDLSRLPFHSKELNVEIAPINTA